MILKPAETLPRSEVGAKAYHLCELKTAGFNVPNFRIISSKIITDIVTDDKVLATVCEELATIFLNKQLAVRSAAFTEDDGQSSQAGQFLTVLDVATKDLPLVIKKVIANAVEKKVRVEQFSIIIQEYIVCDYSGVVFSRDPYGGVNLVLEYVKGSNLSVVRGETVTRMEINTLSSKKYTNQISFIPTLIQQTHMIEAKYSFPQDIEWVVKDNHLYILQTRPITSIGRAHWQGILFLEKNFKNKGDFFYQQTTVSEIFHNPKTLAYSILKKLYAEGGAIEKTYKNLGIDYRCTEQHLLIGNTLFVDKQSEAHSIFPALGYIKRKSSTLKLERVKGFFTTYINSLKLSLLSLKPYPELQNKLETIMEFSLSESDSLVQRWDLFMTQYPTIFEIAVRSQKAVTNLENLLKGSRAIVVQALQVQPSTKLLKDRETFVGNSVSIDDTTIFSVVEESGTANAELEMLVALLPRWKRKAVIPHIEKVQQYMRLREQSRWASIKLMSHLRRGIIKFAENKMSDSDLVFFATIDEILANSVDEKICKKRSEEYTQYQHMQFPKEISNFQTTNLSKNKVDVGLSKGVASGVLVTSENLSDVVGKKILYTKILSPDLTKYFKDIEGIVSQQGGLLSHLAIMAREAHIPVVVSSKKMNLGRRVYIDGSRGIVDCL